MVTGFNTKISALSGILDHKGKPYVAVTQQWCTKRTEKQIYQIAGWAGNCDMAVHNSTIRNLERGVLERVFFVKDEEGNFVRPPRPNQDEFMKTVRSFTNALVSMIETPTKMSDQQFAASYFGRRKTIYENAALSLARDEIKEADSFITCFGKAEKTNLSKKPDPPMRVVSPRNPRYNVKVGVYLKPLEHEIYRAVKALFGETTIFKGLNAKTAGIEMQAKWDKYTNPVAISTDASRFDQHVSIEALRWEHSIYLAIYNDDPELARLLKWQLTNHCRGYCRDGKLKYTVQGTRMSGDMNTALGNCLIMCALVYSYCKERGIKKYSLANNGDDCVIICEQADYHKFVHNLHPWFKNMGFNMKVEEPVYELEQIDFCQTHPVYDGESYLMVRDPKIALSKDCISLKELNNQSIYCKMVGAIGECGISLTGGIPIFQDFYSGMIRANTTGKVLRNDMVLETGMFNLARGMHKTYREVSQRTRYSFWLAFGITPDLQIEVERYYKQNTPFWKGVEKSTLLDQAVVWF